MFIIHIHIHAILETILSFRVTELLQSDTCDEFVTLSHCRLNVIDIGE